MRLTSLVSAVLVLTTCLCGCGEDRAPDDQEESVRELYRTDQSILGMGWSVSRNGKYVLLDRYIENGLILFDIEEEREVWRIEDLTEESVQDMDFSPDDRYAAIAAMDGIVRIVDVEKGEVARSFEGQGVLRDILWLANGKGLVTGGSNCPLVLWDPDTGTELRRYGEEDYSSRHLSASADGSLFVSAGWDGDVRIWDVNESVERHCIPNPQLGRIMSVAISPDGENLLVGFISNPILLFDAATGTHLHRFGLRGNPWFTGKEKYMGGAAFAEDGATALFSTRHGVLFYWDVAAWKEIARAFLPRETECLFIDFCKDGSSAIVLAENKKDGRGVLFLWDLPSSSNENHLTSEAQTITTTGNM